MIDSSNITAIILCGGQGARLNGLDKPLIDLGGKRVIECLLGRLESQADTLILSCSRNVALYEALGHQVVVDDTPHRGPLAGLHEAFNHVDSEWGLTLPGDVPFVPRSLVVRLQRDAELSGIAVPSVDGYRQNLCLLLNRPRMLELSEFYAGGGIAVKHWLDRIGARPTDLSDCAEDFLNINTDEDLTKATARFQLDIRGIA